MWKEKVRFVFDVPKALFWGFVFLVLVLVHDPDKDKAEDYP
jgi:hypothetical protein